MWVLQVYMPFTYYVCVCVCIFFWPVLSAFAVFPWQAVLIGWPWGTEISCLAPNQHASLIHHPLPPQLLLCVSVWGGKWARECQREVCAFRRSHTLLFLLKCFSSPWRRLMRYDITALCFIFKRWAGSPSLPLNEAEVPTEYMESACAWMRVHARIPASSHFLAMRAMCISVGALLVFLHTLTNTHFTHNPWRFLSWSHVSDLIGYRINNTTLTQLPTPLPTGNAYHRFHHSSLSFHFCSSGNWGWFWFCLHICPRCWSTRA